MNPRPRGREFRKIYDLVELRKRCREWRRLEKIDVQTLGTLAQVPPIFIQQFEDGQRDLCAKDKAKIYETFYRKTQEFCSGCEFPDLVDDIWYDFNNHVGPKSDWK